MTAKYPGIGCSQNHDMGPVLPAHPVRLFGSAVDPCVVHLHVLCFDQVGILFKVCDLLAGHGIDIHSASVTTADGIVSNKFELHTSRPCDLSDAPEWCKELEEFMLRNSATGGTALASSLAAVSRRLSVNPDLLSVVSFREIPARVGPSPEFHYSLELEGINQSGLLTYAALVLYKCGFSVLSARISTVAGQISDTFELATTSTEAEHLLRSYLDVPSRASRRYSAPLPFHATKSDSDLEPLIRLWDRRGSRDSRDSRDGVPHSSRGSTPRGSRTGSFNEEDEPARSRLCSLSNLEEAEHGPSQPGASGHSSRPSGPSRQPKGEEPEVYTMSVHFPNGDMYAGTCSHIGGSDRRHGLGAYVYASSTHEAYKQYRGQWREDKKHGFGVLFYRNGGVYVGQWDTNQKHGLGVLLECPGAANNPTAMPSYRYEGQWHEDTPHGLGVEENDNSSYFGQLVRGKQQGRGVRMNLKKLGTLSCEVLSANFRVVPLLEALEAEMASWRPSHSSSPSRCDVPEPAPLAFHPSSSSQVPMRSSLASPFSVAELEAKPSAGSATTAPHDREDYSTGSKTTGDGQSPLSGGISLARPGELASPNGRCHRDLCDRGDRGDRDDGRVDGLPRSEASPPPARALGREERLSCSSLGSGSARSSRRSPILRASRSPSPSPSPIRGWSGDGDVVISLWEENDLLSPSGVTLSRPLPEAAGTPRRARSTSPVPSPVAAAPSPRRPSKPGPGPAEAPEARRTGPRGPLRSPLLWGEEELAAFVACLGVSPEACLRLRQRRLKGASQLLDMSNSQMRAECGLVCPVERLVVRQSLRRLLDADRWENSVRAHRVGDIMDDSVLIRYILPLEELTLVTKISQGGYGTVYRGVFEPVVDRGGLKANKSHLVAVKEMKGERRVRMYELMKESSVMASLTHPNICTFIGICADASGKKHYIISELLDCSLFDLIHQPCKIHWHGDFSVSLVVHLSSGISAGISYLHTKNVVHADLKSSNILIDYSSSWQLMPRICDFGHAAVRSHPSPHHRCGTPHWAAPEVLRSEALGPAADIYSFGVIVWEMLAQKLPHKGLSFGQVLASVGWAGWSVDMSQLPEVPPELRGLIKRCLSFLPSERPSSKGVQRHLWRIPRQARKKALTMLAEFLG